MHQITDASIACNDIIPRQLMPNFNPDDIESLNSQFGENIVNLYRSLLNYSKYLENTLQFLLKKDSDFNSNMMVMAMHKMGVAEAGALITMMHYQLLKHHFIDYKIVILTNRQVSCGHTVILMNESDIKAGQNFIKKFEDFPDTVLIVDPLLNYVGPANQYYSDNHEYLSRFNLSRVLQADTPDLKDMSSLITMESKCSELLKYLDESNIKPFMSKKLLPLAKTGYPCRDAHVLENADELALLQSSSSHLEFSALKHQNGSIDAFCPAVDRNAVAEGLSISKKLGAGSFYCNFNQQRIFVIPAINHLEKVTALSGLSK